MELEQVRVLERLQLAADFLKPSMSLGELANGSHQLDGGSFTSDRLGARLPLVENRPESRIVALGVRLVRLRHEALAPGSVFVVACKVGVHRLGSFTEES